MHVDVSDIFCFYSVVICNADYITTFWISNTPRVSVLQVYFIHPVIFIKTEHITTSRSKQSINDMADG